MTTQGPSTVHLWQSPAQEHDKSALSKGKACLARRSSTEGQAHQMQKVRVQRPNLSGCLDPRILLSRPSFLIIFLPVLLQITHWSVPMCSH